MRDDVPLLPAHYTAAGNILRRSPPPDRHQTDITGENGKLIPLGYTVIDLTRKSTPSTFVFTCTWSGVTSSKILKFSISEKKPLIKKITSVLKPTNNRGIFYEKKSVEIQHFQIHTKFVGIQRYFRKPYTADYDKLTQ